MKSQRLDRELSWKVLCVRDKRSDRYVVQERGKHKCVSTEKGESE